MIKLKTKVYLIGLCFLPLLAHNAENSALLSWVVDKTHGGGDFPTVWKDLMPEKMLGSSTRPGWLGVVPTNHIALDEKHSLSRSQKPKTFESELIRLLLQKQVRNLNIFISNHGKSGAIKLIEDDERKFILYRNVFSVIGKALRTYGQHLQKLTLLIDSCHSGSAHEPFKAEFIDQPILDLRVDLVSSVDERAVTVNSFPNIFYAIDRFKILTEGKRSSFDLDTDLEALYTLGIDGLIFNDFKKVINWTSFPMVSSTHLSTQRTFWSLERLIGIVKRQDMPVDVRSKALNAIVIYHLIRPRNLNLEIEQGEYQVVTERLRELSEENRNMLIIAALSMSMEPYILDSERPSCVHEIENSLSATEMTRRCTLLRSISSAQAFLEVIYDIDPQLIEDTLVSYTTHVIDLSQDFDQRLYLARIAIEKLRKPLGVIEFSDQDFDHFYSKYQKNIDEKGIRHVSKVVSALWLRKRFSTPFSIDSSLLTFQKLIRTEEKISALFLRAAEFPSFLLDQMIDFFGKTIQYHARKKSLSIPEKKLKRVVSDLKRGKSVDLHFSTLNQESFDPRQFIGDRFVINVAVYAYISFLQNKDPSFLTYPSYRKSIEIVLREIFAIDSEANQDKREFLQKWLLTQTASDPMEIVEYVYCTTNEFENLVNTPAWEKLSEFIKEHLRTALTTEVKSIYSRFMGITLPGKPAEQLPREIDDQMLFQKLEENTMCW